MKYRWTTCPGCRCEIAINYTESPPGILGSVRRWNHDRTINDGRPLQMGLGDRAPGGGFVVECPCGQKLDVPARPDAVSAEREADLRVKLGE
jgi:hypothetical protein